MVKQMVLPSVFPGECTGVGGQGFQVVSGQGLGVQLRDRAVGFQKSPPGSRNEEEGSM